MNDPARLLKKAAKAYEIMSKIRLVALNAWSEIEDPYGAGSQSVRDVLSAHHAHLVEVFPEISSASNLARHIHFNMKGDYWDSITNDLPTIEAAITKLVNGPVEERGFGFAELLDPGVAEILTQKAEGVSVIYA